MASNGNQEIVSVAVKLPEFWLDDPDLWFARVEAQFHLQHITQDATKYNHIVAALDNNTASELKATLLHPPEDNRYEALKLALIETYAPTQAQKDAELLSLSGLGDRKPTALLRKIRALNSDPQTLLRAFFLAQLPPYVRRVLAGRGLTDLDELATAADRIMEVPAPDISTVSVEDLSHRRSGRASGGSASSPPHDAFTCFYHLRFGDKARRCQPGCRFADSHPSLSTTPHQDQGNAQAGRQACQRSANITRSRSGTPAPAGPTW